jgi:hypothetical protein
MGIIFKCINKNFQEKIPGIRHSFFSFLAPLANGKVSFCHHLASVHVHVNIQIIKKLGHIFNR